MTDVILISFAMLIPTNGDVINGKHENIEKKKAFSMNEKSLFHKIKSVFHDFEWAFIEANKNIFFGKRKSYFKIKKIDLDIFAAKYCGWFNTRL